VRKLAEDFLGTVTHYYDKIMVAVVELAKGTSLKKGETIHVKGKKADFNQTVNSLQIEHKDVEQVKAGESFGMKVDQPVDEGDAVYRVS
jgi:translation initiation factor IF-2